MILSVTSFKGGVGKTTTAVHLAAILSAEAPTVLVDGDPNRSVTSWAAAGKGLPFAVADVHQSVRIGRTYEHIVIDTEARPDTADLTAIATGCDLLILPSTPDALSLAAMFQMAAELKRVKAASWQILLTMVPPFPSTNGAEAMETIRAANLPLFASSISRLAAFQRASLDGITIREVAGPRSLRGWNEYCAVRQEIL